MEVLKIIYSDNHILVVDKPAGMLTQPDGSGAESLEEAAKAWVKQRFNKPGAVFLHAIHRLDRPASGLVLFARTSKALSRLNEHSRQQKIKRLYQIEVEGKIEREEGVLEHYLIHGDHQAIVAKKNDEGAKLARLSYQVVQRLPHSTVVEVELETGRYHQIRAQFSAIGHPVVGDRRYGSKSGDGKVIELYCIELELEHPVTHEALVLSSSHK